MLTVLFGAVALAILTLFGLPILALLRESLRVRLLPALPVFGVFFLVVVNYALAWALPVRVTTWIAVGIALVLVAVGVFRTRPVLARYRFAWRHGLALLGVVSIAALIAWTPSLLVGSPLVVQPSANNDAIWYVAAVEWIRDHTLVQAPDIGSSPQTGVDGVLYGPALEAFRNATRMGQEMVMATVSVLTGIDLVNGFSPWIGTWAMLGGFGAWVFGEAYRLPARSRIALAALLAISGSLVHQVMAQNAASVLGIALVPAALGLVGSAIGPPAARRVPFWLAGLGIAAVLGVYSEFLPFLGIALAVIVLVVRPRLIPRRLLAATAILVASVVLAPLIWWRTLSSTIIVGGIASTGGERWDVRSAVWGVFGTFGRMIDETSGKTHLVAVAATACLVIVVLVGLLAAVLSPRTRGLALGAGLAPLLIAGYLGLVGNPYVAFRAADMIGPFLVLSAGMGWLELIRFSRGRGPILRRLVVAAAVLAFVGVVTFNGWRAVSGVTSRVWSDRVVTAEFDQAAQWIEARGGEGGERVTVAVATLWDQLWLGEALAKHPDVAWLNIRGDLGYRGDLGMTRFWDGESDPLVLVGPGAYASSGVSAIEANERFSLVDRFGSGAIAVPDATTGTWGWVLDRGSITAAGPSAVRVLVGAGGGDYALELSGLPARESITVDVGGVPIEIEADGSGGAIVPVIDAVPMHDILIRVDAAGGFRLDGIVRVR